MAQGSCFAVTIYDNTDASNCTSFELTPIYWNPHLCWTIYNIPAWAVLSVSCWYLWNVDIASRGGVVWHAKELSLLSNIVLENQNQHTKICKRLWVIWIIFWKWQSKIIFGLDLHPSFLKVSDGLFKLVSLIEEGFIGILETLDYERIDQMPLFL